jgi:hypothetical protein
VILLVLQFFSILMKRNGNRKCEYKRGDKLLNISDADFDVISIHKYYHCLLDYLALSC